MKNISDEFAFEVARRAEVLPSSASSVTRKMIHDRSNIDLQFGEAEVDAVQEKG